MLRGLLLAVWMCFPALAQPGQFLLRMEPARKNLTVGNMNAEESRLASEHFAYLKALLAEGKLAFAGQALDPKGLWGVIVVNAADADAARSLMEGDPAVKAKMFRGVVIPFRTVLKRCE